MIQRTNKEFSGRSPEFVAGFELGQREAIRELTRKLRDLLDVPSNEDLQALSDELRGYDP